MSRKPTDLSPKESKQWDHTVEFEMNYCRHYEPKPGFKLNQCDCAVGVDRNTLPEITDKGTSRWNFPCIGGHGLPNVMAICPKWERHTQEDGEKRAMDTLRCLRKMTLAGPVVSAWRKKSPQGKQEVIECPVCKGRLHLTQASYNGHVHGHCETKDCLNWME